MSISRYSPFYFTVLLVPAMITTTEVDITTQGGSTTLSGSSIQGGSSTQAAGKTISCLNPIPIPDHNPLLWGFSYPQSHTKRFSQGNSSMSI